MRSLLLASAISLAATAAMAQAGPIIAYPPQNDTVNLVLSEEDWVPTATARTELAVDASLPGSDAGKVRGDMYKKVNEALAQLNQAEPDRKYRVMSVNFNAQPITINANNPQRFAPNTAVSAPLPSQNNGGQPIELSAKIQMNANVTFAAHPANE